MATAVHTTIVDRSVGDPLTEAIWDDQIKDNGNQLAGAHRNLLTNGGCEVWQRGAGAFVFTSLNQGYTADRWLAASDSGTTSTITRETSIVDTDSAASLKYVTSGGSATLTQKLEDFAQLRGRTVSFSCRVRQSAASSVALNISDGSSTTGATSATTGSFVTLTVTRTISTSASIVQVYASIGTGVTVYLDNAMLVIGPAPAPYQPLHPQEDLARCQRYYEVHGGVASAYPDLQMRAGAAEALHHSYSFAVPKAVLPTMTKNGTWAVSNCGQPSVVGFTTTGYTLSATASGAGLMAFNPNGTDDTITAEANP